MHQTEKEVNFFIKKKKSMSGASSLVAIVLPFKPHINCTLSAYPS